MFMVRLITEIRFVFLLKVLLASSCGNSVFSVEIFVFRWIADGVSLLSAEPLFKWFR